MARYQGRTPSFIVPYKGKGWTTRKSNKGPEGSGMDKGAKQIEQGKKNFASGVKPSNAMDAASRILSLMGTPSEIIAARVVIGIIENAANSLANNSAVNLPFHYQNSSLDVDNTKIHIVRFNVGRNSTKSVKSAESIHGVTKLQISNSLSECQDLESRKYLSRSFGFNEKSIDFLGTKFYTVVNDYEAIYSIKNYRLPVYGARVPYGLVKEEFSNVRIRNSNTYHRLKFKINIIKIIDDDLGMSGLYGKVVNELAVKQDFGALPVVYQISDREKTKSFPYVRSVLCHYGVSLKKSSNFLTQAKLVKTFTKTLNPGDTFDFRMTHHMGPGIRIAKKNLGMYS